MKGVCRDPVTSASDCALLSDKGTCGNKYNSGTTCYWQAEYYNGEPQSFGSDADYKKLNIYANYRGTCRPRTFFDSCDKYMMWNQCQPSPAGDMSAKCIWINWGKDRIYGAVENGNEYGACQDRYTETPCTQFTQYNGAIPMAPPEIWCND